MGGAKLNGRGQVKWMGAKTHGWENVEGVKHFGKYVNETDLIGTNKIGWVKMLGGWERWSVGG